MKRITMAVLLAALLGTTGCTNFGMTSIAPPQPEQGRTATTIPGWRSQLASEAFYIRVFARAVARTEDNTDTSVCHNNLVSRYFREDRVVTLFASSGDSANPINIPVMVFSDKDIDPSTGGAVCRRSFQDHAVTPYIIFPNPARIPTRGVPIRFSLVTVNNSTLNVTNIFSDLSLLLGLVGGGPTSGAVAAIGVLTSAATRSTAQQAVDQAAKGQSIIEQPFVIDIATARQGPDEATARIMAVNRFSGAEQPLADLVIGVAIQQSFFENQMQQTDVATGKLRFGDRFSAERIRSETLYDPRAPNSPTGAMRPVREIVLDRLGASPSDGADTWAAYRAAFDAGNPVAQTQANQFCNKIRTIFRSDGITLTRRDQNIILWSFVSNQNAYRDASGIFSDSDGQCFDQADIDQLRDMNLSLPGSVRSTVASVQPPPTAQPRPATRLASALRP
jgi:hypothetical protein